MDHRDRAWRTAAALRVGILALLAAAPDTAFAGGVPAAALTNSAGRAKPTPASVSIDYSALDPVSPGMASRGLLVPRVPSAEAPIILHPPAGVAPVKLRPPPGVRRQAARSKEAPKAEPKARAPKPLPETKTAALPPERTPPRTAPAKPAPAAAAAAAKAGARPPAAKPAPTQAAAPPKQTASPPPSTSVATAGQPRSLLTPPPASAPAAAPSATKPEEKVASLPPPANPNQPDTLRISFGVGGAELPPDAITSVRTLAQRLAKDPGLRVQLVAYASDPEKSISRSRRLSLRRAVAVRKVLLAAGVESTRIDLRALGEQSGGGPPDRVDAITSHR